MTDPSEPIDAEIVPDDTPVVTPSAPQPSTSQPPLATDYDDRGVPSFDYVRDKIEGRHATSVGMGELMADTPQGRSVEEQEADREKAAKARLDEIRRSLG